MRQRLNSTYHHLKALLLQMVLLAVAAFGTLLQVLEIANPRVRWSLVAGLLALVLLVLWFEAWRYRSGQPRRFYKTAKINRFMRDWIASEGRVVIFSRDLSWAAQDYYVSSWERLKDAVRSRQRPTIRDLLRDKAGNRELMVCVPRRIAITDALVSEGAEVVTYEELALTPQSRFTLIRHGRGDAEIAIGRMADGVHLIERFSPGEHPAFWMATDLLALVEAVDRSRS